MAPTTAVRTAQLEHDQLRRAQRHPAGNRPQCREGVFLVADLTFTDLGETETRHADLRLAMSDKPGTAWAYLPNTAAEGGDAWFNSANGYYTSPVKGNYAYMVSCMRSGTRSVWIMRMKAMSCRKPVTRWNSRS